jgi:hypothetical protein
MTPTARLREVARGREPDELQFIASDGRVLLAHAHGVHLEERRRTREAILTLLREQLGQG